MAETMLDTIIVGGGQAGLAMGHYLAKQGRNFRILDASPETGYVWRSRWDSLRLFTPVQYNALPGMPFPGEHNYLPTKDEAADYLVDYAKAFQLPITFNHRVSSIRKVKDAFEVDDLVTRNVVVATGPFRKPRIPSFAARLNVPQMHSVEYRNASQIPDGSRVMVVGAANSGVQIAAELATSHTVSLATSRHLPVLPKFVAGVSIFWYLSQIGFFSTAEDTRHGRFFKKRELLIGESRAVPQTGRAIAASANTITTTDGTKEIDAVVWATGFQPDFGFVKAPVFNEAGRPVQKRGVTDMPGLYFLGLPWMHTRGSALMGWVGNDAEYLSQQILKGN